MTPPTRARLTTLILLALFLATMVTGTVGWSDVYANDPARGWPEALYMALLAFGGDTSYNSKQALESGWLVWTRFLGPSTAVAALLAIAGAVLGSRLLRWRAGRRRGHVVVVGASAFAVALAERRAADAGSRVTVLDDAASLDAVRTSDRRGDTLLVAARPDDVAPTRALMGAPDLVVYGARESIRNLERARRVGAIGGARIQVRIEDGSVARDLAYMSDTLARAEIVSLSESIARALVTGLAPSDLARIRGQARVHLALVGLGSVNLAVAEELVQRCHHPDLQPVRLSVFDRDATAALARLRAERPGLASYGHLALHELEVLQCCAKDMAHPLRDAEKQAPLTAIVVATGDETRNLAIAMRLRELQLHHLCLKAPILVRSDSKGSVGPDPITDLSGGVVRFGGRTPDSEDIALQGVYEALGRSLHEGWRAARRDVTPSPMDVPWEALSAADRLPSLRPAMNIDTVMRAVGMAPDPGSGVAGLRACPEVVQAILNDPGRVAVLAEMEHERWTAERAMNGFVPAEDGPRDDEKRRHPLMKAFAALLDAQRNLDDNNVVKILHLAEQRAEDARSAPRWRRLLRVGVIGPLLHDPSLDTVVAERFRAHLRGLDLPLEAYNLEVVTPNAPGFDREAARVLLETWRGDAKRPARLLLLQAARAPCMDAIAARSLQPASTGDDEAVDVLEAFVADAQRQQAAMTKAAGDSRCRVVDMRPLETSDAELARDMPRYLDNTSAVAAHVDALCDLLVIATSGGGARHSTQALEARRSTGRAVLAID